MPDAQRLLHKRQRFEPAVVTINGHETACYLGETVATVLLATGVGAFRRTASGAPRRPVCNMGVCFDCIVTIDGVQGQRSCMITVLNGMQIEVADDV
ncbi:(2Fe-2S)-binding protein [Alcaligenes sp. DN25]|uniref:(2Fe-2S)-binding protein n=1 Tax=Alcaligenes TaxID=507 RepID=UPI00202F889D|nr:MULTISPECIES: (2Fe-2S)-binding protein [Alcaligenes]URW82808.1 (2Fe-2S)-binding protein [Alcaligenes sp. DN25]WEA67635.1 (2Fe-2S)-binding protein [Alcaligenes faecalis]